MQVRTNGTLHLESIAHEPSKSNWCSVAVIETIDGRYRCHRYWRVAISPCQPLLPVRPFWA